MHFIHDLSNKMPSENCGLCNQTTCRVATLHISKGEMDPSNCSYLLNEKRHVLEEIYKMIDEGIEPDVLEEGKGFDSISPCPSDPEKLMLVYYPQRVEDLSIHLYDGKQMEALLSMQSIFLSRSSPELGFSRIENDRGEYALIFSKGKVVARQAFSEQSGKKFIQSILNLIWLSKSSCGKGYLILDGFHGLCDCKTTLTSLTSGPENILEEEQQSLQSLDNPIGFFSHLTKSISENITPTNVNKYLQICNINLRLHLNQLVRCENRDKSITKAMLASKWIALYELIKTAASKYSNREDIKTLSTIFKALNNKDIDSIIKVFSEAKDCSWPKNFVKSKMALNAKKYLSVPI